ncbi:hypothetical protein KL939_004984 [Ogataea angusta]|nr:hypothetical protein KL939_004984 [Ogataea angusta]
MHQKNRNLIFQHAHSNRTQQMRHSREPAHLHWGRQEGQSRGPPSVWRGVSQIRACVSVGLHSLHDVRAVLYVRRVCVLGQYWTDRVRRSRDSAAGGDGGCPGEHDHVAELPGSDQVGTETDPGGRPSGRAGS